MRVSRPPRLHSPPGGAENPDMSSDQRFHGIGLPFEHARLELPFGQFHRRAVRRRAGAELLSSAERRIREHRAEPHPEHEHELVACGLHPRSTSTTAVCSSHIRNS
jgi:hypothetical protein